MPKKQEKVSTAGFVLSLIGGLLILGVGLFYTLFMPLLGFLSPGLGFLGFMGVWGMVSGIFVIAGSIVAYAGYKLIGGIVVLVFSILSFGGTGGLIIGMALGIIGGILILVKK